MWRNDPAVYKYCRQHTFLSEDDHERWLTSLSSRGDVKMFGVYINSNDAVGVCGLTSIETINQTAEFSLYIGPTYQGRGYGKTALLELLKVGFFELNLNRIWGETFEENPAAKLFENVGMTNEGRLRQTYYKAGKHIDSYIYSILRSEYDSRYHKCDSPNSD